MAVLAAPAARHRSERYCPRAAAKAQICIMAEAAEVAAEELKKLASRARAATAPTAEAVVEANMEIAAVEMAAHTEAEAVEVVGLTPASAATAAHMVAEEAAEATPDHPRQRLQAVQVVYHPVVTEENLTRVPADVARTH